MIRNLKALGLALVAVLATGALIASGASASKVVASAGAVTVHAEQSGTHEFVLTDNSNLKSTCKKATFEGPIPAGGTATPLVHPTYSECTCFGLNCTVTTTGCDYEFHVGDLSSHSAPADADVECGLTGAIVLTTLTCGVRVTTQQTLTKNTGTNNTTSGDITLDTEVTGIDYEVYKDGIGCPLSKVGSFIDGDYTGVTTIKAPSGTLQIQ